MGFFGWTATPDNRRHEIVLRYQGTEYEARIEQTVHDRYRLFWPNFARQVQRQWPDLYAQVRAGGHVGEPAPLIEFSRVATDIYEIEFLNAVESDGVTAGASNRGPRVWWVNQSDSWDVEYGDRVVRSSRYKRVGAGHAPVAADTKYRQTVGQARRDDIVVHARGPHIVAFSRALEDGEAHDELPGNYIAGWQFRSEYFVLSNPVPKGSFRHQFVNDNHPKGYALTRRGTVNQGYFFCFDYPGLAIILDYVDLNESLPTWLTQHMGPGASVSMGELELAETERIAIANTRMGQAIFRSGVISLWGSCAVTGVASEQLLRASHIKPWRQCSNRERLDPANGLLLTPTLDHLFDRGLITFESDGSIVISESLASSDIAGLGVSTGMRLRWVPDGVVDYMRYHNQHVFT